MIGSTHIHSLQFYTRLSSIRVYPLYAYLSAKMLVPLTWFITHRVDHITEWIISPNWIV